MAKKTKNKFKKGDKVTPKIEKEPYYSDYAGNPKVVIKPGEIGTVAAIDVPCVHQTRREFDAFICVDFYLSGVFHGDPRHNNCTWRCSFYPDEIEYV